jgi:hypothetical protein
MSLLEAESVPREITDRHYIAKNLKRFHEAVCRLPLPTALRGCPLSTPHGRQSDRQISMRASVSN